MSMKMIELRGRFIVKYGENCGRIMFVDFCQRKGIDPVTGDKL